MRTRVADHVDESFRERVGGARLNHRRRERDHPADEDDGRPGDPAICLIDGEHPRERRSRPRRAARPPPAAPRPWRAGSPSRRGSTSVCFAPGPSGTACRRTSAGSSTTSTSGSSRWYSSAPQEPCRSSVSPTASSVSPGRSSPLRCTASTTRSPLSVTIPGNTVSPISSGPRRDDHLRHARLPADERVGVVVERVLIDERPGEVAEVPLHRARLPGRQQPLAEEDDDRDRPGEQRNADERELEEPEPAHPRVIRVPGDDDVDRRPGEREQRPGMRSERERHQDLGRRHAEADGHHGDDGQKGGDGAVHADQRCEHGDEQHHQDYQPRTAVSRACDQLLPGPGRDARRVESFADDEQRRDEDHRRVAEAGERLVEVEDSRRPERERDPECHDRRPEAGPTRRRPPRPPGSGR